MTTQPDAPRLSATVLIVRDGANIPEVLMVKRHYQIDFAAGALVFPGGKANAEDASADWDPYTDGDFGPVQQDARIAAVREAYEESGLLLARPRAQRGTNQPLVGPDMAEKLDAFRSAVDRGEQSFLELIRDNDLVLALDSLVYFGHWITPDMMPKRFDTHFYVAPAPPDQIAAHDAEETGEAIIIFPTRMNLKKFATASSVADAVERFGRETVITVKPQQSETPEGEPCLIIPDVEGYGQTVELLSRVNV